MNIVVLSPGGFLIDLSPAVTIEPRLTSGGAVLAATLHGEGAQAASELIFGAWEGADALDGARRAVRAIYDAVAAGQRGVEIECLEPTPDVLLRLGLAADGSQAAPGVPAYKPACYRLRLGDDAVAKLAAMKGQRIQKVEVAGDRVGIYTGEATPSGPAAAPRP